MISSIDSELLIIIKAPIIIRTIQVYGKNGGQFCQKISLRLHSWRDDKPISEKNQSHLENILSFKIALMDSYCIDIQPPVDVQIVSLM